MKIIALFLSLFNFITNPFSKRKIEAEISTIDIKDPLKFHTLASLTIDLSQDMYCNTMDIGQCGNNFFSFIKNPRYDKYGKEFAHVNADVENGMPKILVYDWNGNKTASLGPARIIAFRGTHSRAEWEHNFDCTELPESKVGLNIKGYFHKDFAKVGKKIWDNYKKYITESKIPVIITGHSRGAALAEMVHVIAKKHFLNENIDFPIYCIAHAPPPSMHLTDEDRNELTKHIYGIVNGDDAIPRFFAATIIKIYNAYNAVKDLLFDICTDHYSDEDCTINANQIIGILLDILSPIISKGIDSFATEGLKKHKQTLYNMMVGFNFDPSKVKIQQHVGTLYQLKWTNLADTKKVKKKDNHHGCVKAQLENQKLASTNLLTSISIIPFKKVPHLLGDHYSQYYRHAIQDPLCTSLQPKTNLYFDDINESIQTLANDPTIPSWVPDINDGDDLFSCASNQLSNPKEFSWRNYDTDMYCYGQANDCNVNKLTAIRCMNSTHHCQYPKEKGDECLVYNTLGEGADENRCMEEKGDEVYKISSSYDHSSSGSSSNINKHSSSGSSNADGHSSSGSSNNGRSSTNLSNDDHSDDPESCPASLGNFPIKVAYVGGTTLVKFSPAYYVMRKSRQVAGHIVPPPNFLHTAIWVGSSDATNESLGAIFVYGEYYSNGKNPTYLSCDGARSFVMPLYRFKEEFDAFDILKLVPQRNISLLSFINEIGESGYWTADDYKWTTHNCQHFSANCLNILKAKRFKSNKHDWTNLPSNIMKVIYRNELTF